MWEGGSADLDAFEGVEDGWNYDGDLNARDAWEDDVDQFQSDDAADWNPGGALDPFAPDDAGMDLSYIPDKLFEYVEHFGQRGTFDSCSADSCHAEDAEDASDDVFDLTDKIVRGVDQQWDELVASSSEERAKK